MEAEISSRLLESCLPQRRYAAYTILHAVPYDRILMTTWILFMGYVKLYIMSLHVLVLNFYHHHSSVFHLHPTKTTTSPTQPFTFNFFLLLLSILSPQKGKTTAKMVSLTRVIVLAIAAAAMGVEASKVGHAIKGIVSTVLKRRGQNSIWERSGTTTAPRIKTRIII
jgi:hypothetical protein